MTGDGGLDGSFGGVGITNLADHDNIGIETEDGAETFGEGATVVGVNWNLGDAGNTIFNRILQGDDFPFGSVQGIKHGIESGRFTGAGRADHEDETTWVRNDLVDLLLFLGGEAEKVKIKQRFVEIEKTEDGILTIHGRDRFDTDIQEMASAVAMDFTLHVAGLRLIGSGRNIGARAELAHEDAIAVAIDIGDWMEDAVDAHANANSVS